MKKFSYFVLLQKGASAPECDSFETYRAYVPDSIRSGAAEFQKIKADAIQTNGSILRGGLGHFLSTPLKSDTEEIVRLIEESIENTVAQLDAAPMLGSVTHTLWRVMDPQHVPLQRQMVGVMKRLLKNGRSMLVDAGCTFGKNSGDVAVSLFEFDGFSTVQTLRSIVEGFHAVEELSVSNGAFLTTAVSIGPDMASEKNVVVIDFDDHDEATVHRLNERFPVLMDQFGIRNITLSRQSLHSSVGAYYQLRIGLDVNKHPLGSVLVSMIGDHEELEEAMTSRGSITVLERFAS
jgi:hypothetical protein